MKAYEPDGWEVLGPLAPLYTAGRYAEAADRGRALADAHPQHATVLYDLACCESRAGRTTDAVDHLGRAIAFRSVLAPSPGRTRTSIRSATSPRSGT